MEYLPRMSGRATFSHFLAGVLPMGLHRVSVKIFLVSLEESCKV